MQYIIFLLILLNVASSIFYTKIINTPIYSKKLLKYHHIVLLQNKPFINGQTIYSNIYAIDFCPCGNNLFEIISGKVMKGELRIFYINYCKTSDVYKVIKKKINKHHLIYEIKNIDIEIFNKLKSWNISFQLYKRNCRHFSAYITK
jgi:hypothetical protein